MKRWICLFLLFFPIFNHLALHAQDDEEDLQYSDSYYKKPKRESRFDWSRAFVGGNLGAQFGRLIFVDISPNFGYFVVEDKLAIATGVTYRYYKDRDLEQALKSINGSEILASGHIYGGRLLTRYYPIDWLFTHAEYELLNVRVDAVDPSTFQVLASRRRNIHHVFLGGGFSQAIGSRAAFTLMILYEVIQDEFSPYRNPVIRMGFSVGL